MLSVLPKRRAVVFTVQNYWVGVECSGPEPKSLMHMDNYSEGDNVKLLGLVHRSRCRFLVEGINSLRVVWLYLIH